MTGGTVPAAAGVFGPWLKGYPLAQPPLTREAIARAGWRVLHGDLPLPLAVLKRPALQHNLHWMREFCAQRGLALAPHGKTTMSPELWQMQLDAGAWGITFATVHQACVGVRHGVRRVLIANQVVQPAELAALARLHDECPGLRSLFLVDSEAQVACIEAWASDSGLGGVFEVLLELGMSGQRTGCRTDAQALALAARIHASPVLALAGVECYEGTTATCDHDRDRAAVRTLMERVATVARAAVAAGWLAPVDAIIVSAGGSAVFDLVAEHLRPVVGRPVLGVLRSGCYLTHDHRHYARYLCGVGERLRLHETLRPALEVLAAVQSQPEPGLALLTMGKRDVSHDIDLPQPVWRADGRGGAPRAVPAHWRIDALNDQHAYLRFDADAPAEEWPRVGEMVGTGISHPCTTFDKWRWMPVVDEGWRVVDAISTWF
jgi:D-serine dehydratase